MAMQLLTRITRAYHALTGDLTPPPAAGHGRTIREAIGAGTDDPDARLPGDQNQSFFSQIGGRGETGNDPSSIEYQRLLKMVRKAYHLNGVPANLVKLTTDFVVGEGFDFRALPADGDQLTPEEQAFGDMLTDWWEEPVNDLQEEHDGLINLLHNEGQYLWPIRAINPIDGHVLLGHEPNDCVDQVIMGGNGKPGFALLRALDGSSQPRRFFLLNSAHPDDTYRFMGGASVGKKGVKVEVTRHVLRHDGTFNANREIYDGIGFYLTIGRMRGATRGWPLLCNIVDYANIHDEIVWGFAERMKSLHKFLLHCKITGATAEEIPRLLEEAGFSTTPEAGQVVGTNEKWEIGAIAPRLNSQNVTDMERVLRMIMAGSLGYPEAWTGSGEDVNRATLVGQNTVTFKRLRRGQKKIMRYFRMVADFQIRQWQLAGVLSLEDPKYEIVRSSLDDKDRAPMAEALNKLVMAMNGAVSGGVLPDAVARNVTVTVLREFGFDITEDDLQEDETDTPQARLVQRLAALQTKNTPPNEEDATDGQQKKSA